MGVRTERGYQRDEVHQAKLGIQLRLGQLDPTPGPPPAETVRPNAPHDPAVEFVEERSNVGSFVILGPTPQGRIQPHTQPFQYPSRSCQRCTRFSHRLTGNHPIVGEPRQLISFASHLLIKQRQKNVTEQWRSYSALWSPALAGKELTLAVA